MTVKRSITRIGFTVYADVNYTRLRTRRPAHTVGSDYSPLPPDGRGAGISLFGFIVKLPKDG